MLLSPGCVYLYENFKIKTSAWLSNTLILPLILLMIWRSLVQSRVLVCDDLSQSRRSPRKAIWWSIRLIMSGFCCHLVVRTFEWFPLGVSPARYSSLSLFFHKHQHGSKGNYFGTCSIGVPLGLGLHHESDVVKHGHWLVTVLTSDQVNAFMTLNEMFTFSGYFKENGSQWFWM